MAVSFAGMPAIGAAVVGWAAVAASQGKLNIVVVLIMAALGAEAGGDGDLISMRIICPGA